MVLYHVIVMAIVAALVSAATKIPSSHKLNGWYPCSEYTFSEDGSSTGQTAQCAVYKAPLCYPGICEIPEDVDPQVDIFVKRLPATTANPEIASNVWLIQGGPGYSSTSLEYAMIALHSQLNGTVNVYMMDHRGTGRSTLFDCVAAQVTTTGSPFGVKMDASEVPACAKDLQLKYGDLTSFSVTTAAMDLATFISKYTNGKDTIVYGGSYGTMVAERLMHLAPPQVTGYVLDGIATTPGAPAEEFFYVSGWDTNFDEVGETFLRLCKHDSGCNDRFKPSGLSKTFQKIIKQFDNDPNSTCAALVNGTSGIDSPSASFGLRIVLGNALMDSFLRTLIPPVIYRLKRCSSEDVEVLTHFFAIAVATYKAKSQDSAFQSILLYNLIVYSEMWESPMPSMAELKSRFIDTKMTTTDSAFLAGSQYCAFSKEKSKVCDHLNVGTYDSNGIIYKHDKYWNKTATIPSQASVLLMSGKLDPQTPNKYAEFLLKALKGEKKELIAFDYASHGTIVTTRMVAGDVRSESCGMKVLASYVRNGGDLDRLDKSCVDKMPSFNLIIPDYYLKSYFGTEDAYDGSFNSSLTSVAL